jgi:hypothetical protein
MRAPPPSSSSFLSHNLAQDFVSQENTFPNMPFLSRRQIELYLNFFQKGSPGFVQARIRQLENLPDIHYVLLLETLRLTHCGDVDLLATTPEAAFTNQEDPDLQSTPPADRWFPVYLITPSPEAFFSAELRLRLSTSPLHFVFFFRNISRDQAEHFPFHKYGPIFPEDSLDSENLNTIPEQGFFVVQIMIPDSRMLQRISPRIETPPTSS